jgi:hypothetical protein
MEGSEWRIFSLFPLFLVIPLSIFQIVYAQEANNTSSQDEQSDNENGNLLATITGGIIGVSGSLLSVLATNQYTLNKEKRERSIALIQDKAHAYSLLISGLERTITSMMTHRGEIAKEIDSIIKEKSHLISPNIITNWSEISAKIYRYNNPPKDEQGMSGRTPGSLSEREWELHEIDTLNLRTLIIREYNELIVPAYNETIHKTSTKEFSIIPFGPLKKLEVAVQMSQKGEAEEAEEERSIQIEVRVLDAIGRFPVSGASVRVDVLTQSNQPKYRPWTDRTGSEGKFVWETDLSRTGAGMYYNVKVQVAHSEYDSITLYEKLEVN